MAFVTKGDNVFYLITSGPAQDVMASMGPSESAIDPETILTPVFIPLEGSQGVFGLMDHLYYAGLFDGSHVFTVSQLTFAHNASY